MISNRHMNGDTDKTNWFKDLDELMVFGLCPSAVSAVAVDDQVGRSGIECDDVFNYLCKRLCHIYTFVFVLADW